MVASEEPQKARLVWAKLDQWRSFDNLTRSSVPVMARLREFEDEHQHQMEAEEESEAEEENNDEEDEGFKHWTGDVCVNEPEL